MTTETLHCMCGGEVRLVRLNPELTALGHVRNPKNGHHYVRLSRSGQEPRTVNPGRSRHGGGAAPSEGSDTRPREDAAKADPSTETPGRRPIHEVDESPGVSPDPQRARATRRGPDGRDGSRTDVSRSAVTP